MENLKVSYLPFLSFHPLDTLEENSKYLVLKLITNI
nr:MAG TPA: hypothetical protein [Caudoviricetes sp.]